MSKKAGIDHGIISLNHFPPLSLHVHFYCKAVYFATEKYVKQYTLVSVILFSGNPG
jgi:hypothetical protein